MIALDVRCSADGCSERTRRNGLCNTHSQHRRRATLAQTPCAVIGCARGADTRGLCGMHYARSVRSGDVGPLGPLHALPGSKHTTDRGYVLVFAPGHPLAGPKGSVAEHRVVLFDAIGCRDIHRCFWCNRMVLWRARGRHELVVDHLDDNPSNNARWNLVPSCSTCNQPGKPPHKRLIFTLVTAIAGWL